MITSICVFSSSYVSAADCDHFAILVQELAEEFSHRKVRFIYGGGTDGLMGDLAKAVTAAGGRVVGYLPRVFRNEFFQDGLHNEQQYGHLVHVPNFFVQLQLFDENSDAYVAFPGGLGTLSEIVHVLSSIGAGCYKKPIGIVNYQHYYDSILQWISKARDLGFLVFNPFDYIIVDTNIRSLLQKMMTWTPPMESPRTGQSKDSPIQH